METTEKIRVIYNKTLAQKDDGWQLFLAQTDDNDKYDIKCSGVFASDAYNGQPFFLTGTYQSYRGTPTFRFARFALELPANQTELTAFLRSIPGIGKARAETLSALCEGNIEKLAGHTAEELAAACPRFSTAKATILLSRIAHLQKFDVLQAQYLGLLTDDELATVIAAHGERVDTVLSTEPYAITANIGFAGADKVAKHHGMSADNVVRLKTAAQLVLKEQCNRYNAIVTALPQMLDGIHSLLSSSALGNVEAAQLSVALNQLRTEHKIIRTGNYVYLYPAYQAELSLAEWITTTAKNTPTPSEQALYAAAFCRWYDSQSNVVLATAQQSAAYMCGAQKVSVITGAPGTGKTTCLAAIIEAYTRAYPLSEITLLAPTGLAAKRMNTACKRAAKTIHRTLLLQADADSSAVANELPETLTKTTLSGLIIIDEFSMVGLELAATLVSRIANSSDTRVVFVGDVDQLPSISAGTVLSDLITTKAVPVTRLAQNYRQDDATKIVPLSQAINNGNADAVDFAGGCFHVPSDTAPEIIDNLTATYVDMCRQYGVNQTIVLSPMRASGPLCSNKLNAILRDVINPASSLAAELKIGRTWRCGDRVINTKNSAEVVNGDLGTISRINKDTETITVLFDDGTEVVYDRTRVLSSLDWAYSVSVHKAQGGEFACVLMPSFSEHDFMLTRNLVYTAVTRAKKSFGVIGNLDVFKSSANRVPRTYHIHDFLAKRIQANLSPTPTVAA